MALVSLQNVHISFGGPALLENATLLIESNERVCLLGRNGEGKSTLLKILAGSVEPDAGEVVLQNGVRIGILEQEVPEQINGTVYDQVSQILNRETRDDGEAVRRVERAISVVGLEADTPFDKLSGGQKRRALLARALVNEPDVLILDEPTNHLDIESIIWLENFLLRFTGALLFVSHDRAFLRKLATRIVEIDRGSLRSWNCCYDTFLKRRDEVLTAEEKANANFDKKLAQEEVWIRKGIKARRTRNEGRVRALKKMREERKQRRARSGSVNLQLQTGERSGQKVIVTENLSYAWEHLPIVQSLTTTILRGDKIGIIGPNGCGKTTLINLLLKRMEPDTGTVKHGTQLEVAYFDQHRAQLDGEKTVAENIAGKDEFVVINGKKRHIFSYLEDFLFDPPRARTPVSVLSGGERNRLLLARLFTQPNNLLVLDEPTNDLDADTLELLENLLVEYSGTLLLVSHDRDFLNNVVSSTLVFEDDKGVKEYPGGYDDYLEQRQRVIAATKPEKTATKTVKTRSRKLSNKEREELSRLPSHIESLENELNELHTAMNTPDFYQQDETAIRAATERVEAIPRELEQAYTRWEELDAI